MKNLNELINKEKMGINKELFKKYFIFQGPAEMLKFVHDAKKCDYKWIE